MSPKSQTMLLAGTAAIILGMLIITFDYPQLVLLDELDGDHLLGAEGREIHQRMRIEIAVGAALAISGAILLAASFLKNRLGQ